MKIFLKWSALVLGAALICGLSLRLIHLRTRDRCATEGQAAVQEFLRAGADGAFDTYGKFRSLEGDGWYPPVWNIQGYEYLGLGRTARFERGSVQIKIFVTEGRKTAPGSAGIGRPKVTSMNPMQGAILYVSHPDLK